jgi:hypothetical protein
MDSELEMVTGTATATRRNARHVLLTHPFVALLVVGALVGGGLRFVPTGSASGSSGAGQTACAAK